MTTSLYGLTFDCADALRTARFWSEVLGRPLDEASTKDFAAIGVFGVRSGEPA